MATKTIYWSGSSGDRITVTYTGNGNDSVSIASDPNPGTVSRNKTITFATTDGKVTKTVAVIQAGAPGDYNNDYNDDYLNN